MTKTRNSVTPRSHIAVRMPPGAATPRSGVYEQVGPRGGRTGERVDFDPRQPAPADPRTRGSVDVGKARLPQDGQKIRPPRQPGTYCGAWSRRPQHPAGHAPRRLIQTMNGGGGPVPRASPLGQQLFRDRRRPIDCRPVPGRPRLSNGSLTPGARIHATAAEDKSNHG